MLEQAEPLEEEGDRDQVLSLPLLMVVAIPVRSMSTFSSSEFSRSGGSLSLPQNLSRAEEVVEGGIGGRGAGKASFWRLNAGNRGGGRVSSDVRSMISIGGLARGDDDGDTIATS